MKLSGLFGLVALLVGCVGDADGDGVDADRDCNDHDPSIGLATTWYGDGDEDGYGDEAVVTDACEEPEGHVAEAGDCNDADPLIRPGAVEQCNNLDDDCNGAIDDGATAGAFYADDDGDGFGDPHVPVEACAEAPGIALDSSDCDDGNDGVNPDGTELCDGIDNDCDGAIDEEGAEGGAVLYRDADGDDYGVDGEVVVACDEPAGYAIRGGDCDDGDSDIHPGADEHCDNVDEDCDGAIDDAPVDADSYWPDDDGDGFGASGAATAACVPPTGMVDNDDDCNDLYAAVNPQTWWYPDTDGDSWGGSVGAVQQCEDPGPYVLDAGDCDDGSADVHPDAEEICDGVDNNCDGVTDGADASDAPVWYVDADGDGYGHDAVFLVRCSDPGPSYADRGGDCDDTRDDTSPALQEVCDERDNDCDGLVDLDDPSLVGIPTWYPDADGDGYGDYSSSVVSCEVPEGHVQDYTDCDDTNAAVHYGATEICDGHDNDCDGETDGEAAVDAFVLYPDDDGDGYGRTGEGLVSCDELPDHSPFEGDCDDVDPTIHPYADEPCDTPIDINCDGSIGAVDSDGDGYTACEECNDADPEVSPDGIEVCDGADNDCNGEVDDDGMGGSPWAWYVDDDGDGHGVAGAFVISCAELEGYAEVGDDCDDTDEGVFPGNTACSDTADIDCDGRFDTCGLWGAYSLGAAHGKLIGEFDNDQAGYSVAGAGDINGDGYDDVLVGADEADGGGTGSGAVYVVYGPWQGTIDLSSYDAKLVGEFAYDEAGHAAEGAGDVNGDGFGDIIVGAWGNDEGGTDAGSAYLVHGPVSGVQSLAIHAAKYTGSTSSDQIGWSVDTAGDLNDDGFDDVLVGADDDDLTGSDAGAVYVFFGPSSGSHSVLDADLSLVGITSERLGHDVSTAGDVDGDGLPDVIVGAYGSDPGGMYDAGSAYLFLSPIPSWVESSAANAEITGEQAYDRIGYSVSDAGDVNADGYGDLVIGADQESGSGTDKGAAYVFYGPIFGVLDAGLAQAKYTGEVNDDEAGSSVSGGGDVDQDGFDDIVVGADENDEAGDGAGAAYVILGPHLGVYTLLSADLKVTGEASQDEAGWAVSMVGDTNGDGFADVLIGAFDESSGGPDAGAAYLLLGGGR